MTLLPPLIFLASGFLTGIAHFYAISKDARLLLHGGSPLQAFALRLGRICLSVGLLIAGALHGAPALIAALIGFLIARQVFIRCAGAGA